MTAFFIVHNLLLSIFHQSYTPFIFRTYTGIIPHKKAYIHYLSTVLWIFCG